MEMVADANDFLDHEQDMTTAIRKLFEDYERNKPATVAEHVEQSEEARARQLKANAIVNAMMKGLRTRYREGMLPEDANEDLELDLLAQFPELGEDDESE